MSSKRIARLVVLLLFVASACNGGASEQSSDATPTPSATAETDRARNGEPSADGGDGGSASDNGAASSPAPQPTKGGELQPGALDPPAAGGYTFNNTGSETLNCGAPQTREPPKETNVTIDKANGNRQRSVADVRRPDGTGDVTTTILEYRSDGVYLIYLKTEQTAPFLGTNTIEFEPDPPVLVAPNSPSNGQKWSFTLRSKDGDVTVKVDNTIEAVATNVKLGDGSTVSAVRAKSTSRATGDSDFGQIDVTTVSTTWASVEDRLIVKDISDTTGTFSTCEIDEHVESLLFSAKPS